VSRGMVGNREALFGGTVGNLWPVNELKKGKAWEVFREGGGGKRERLSEVLCGRHVGSRVSTAKFLEAATSRKKVGPSQIEVGGGGEGG